ncbi:MAG TPA: 30S ribosomal protein S2 [Spirochaetia bacterium]|nr:30S ribosomal protein S2 [Spirochaetia bacterium]
MATKLKEEVKATPKKEAKKIVKKEVVARVEASPKKVVVKKTVAPKVEKVKDVKAEVKAEAKESKKVATSTIEELFEAGAHFGHVVKKWNPKMKKYLWGAKNGIHIFDLEKTVAGLDDACKALTKAALEGKRIVLVGTKRQAKAMLEEEAKRVGVPFITQRWMGGLITNWKQVKLTLDRLNSLKLKREQGQLKKFTKKEQVLFDKEIARLERVVGGIATLKDAPEVIVAIDTHKEKLAVKEANNRSALVIGLVDSNANPDKVDYVVPMNDDSAKALEIVISAFGKALEAGLKERKDLSVSQAK